VPIGVPGLGVAVPRVQDQSFRQRVVFRGGVAVYVKRLQWRQQAIRRLRELVVQSTKLDQVREDCVTALPNGANDERPTGARPLEPDDCHELFATRTQVRAHERLDDLAQFVYARISRHVEVLWRSATYMASPCLHGRRTLPSEREKGRPDKRNGPTLESPCRRRTPPQSRLTEV
jgi:hypothetical protein